MFLRALALALLMLVHSAAAGVLLHLCAGQARAHASCCCGSAEADAAGADDELAALSRASCCETISVQHSSATVLTAPEQDSPRTEARCLPIEAMVLARVDRLLDADHETIRRARERAGRQATAPPLFLRHCALLI